jgi:hypothetical protein
MAKRAEKDGRAGFVVAAIVNALLLLGVNAHETWLPWTHGVVTEAFPEVLWAVNSALWVQVLGNALLVFTHPLWFRRMAEFGFGLVTILSSAALYQVFPFDFAAIQLPWLTVVARILLILAIVGGALGMVTAMVRMGRGDGTRQRPLDAGI